MLLVLGIALVLGLVLLCGVSPIDEKKSEDQRLHLGLGIFVFTVVLSLIVGFVL